MKNNNILLIKRLKKIISHIYIKMVKCIKCSKALKIIGRDRKNGVNSFKDWETRQLHKKCWKELKEDQNLIFNMANTLSLPDTELYQMLEDFKNKYGLEKLL